MKYLKFYLVAFLIILLDQSLKLWVHHHMEFGTAGEIPIFGNWFKLHYTINEGMAFGIKLGEEYGKLILTFFRIVAVIAIGYYVYYLVKKKYPQAYIWCISLILGGAVGNVIDSVFYGVFLEGNASYYPSEEEPWLYPWFHGKVIDMFYLDIWQGYLPENIPLIGGSYIFLWPIFNVADSSIFIGVCIILLFQRKFFVSSTETTQIAESSKHHGNNTTVGT
ncbi:MAG: lipoprotein signal peptidase [Cytophagales bacterium]|nr:lipoprotein signal peptidase [Cytophagales bacterium]MDW8384168.1 lipoprotein signal peptidase [Flammeovirgaceae bacterium]